MFSKTDGPTALRSDLVRSLSFSLEKIERISDGSSVTSVAALAGVWNGRKGHVAILVRDVEPAAILRYVGDAPITSADALDAAVEEGLAFAESLGFAMDAPDFLTLTGEAAGDGFGIGPADAGDVNGDGHDDLVIGAWQQANAAASGGKVYLYSGKDGSLIRAWTGKVMGETFGFDATGMGDVDGDGLLEMAWIDSKNNLYVWDLAGPAAADLPWAMFHHDAAHSGLSLDDVDADGFLDMVLHYHSGSTGIGADDVEACLMGETWDGLPAEGCDAVTPIH